MGSPIKEKGSQVQFLKQRLTMFSEVLDSIKPEEVDLEDIDRLINIIDELENKCKEFTNRDEQ
ncbi:SE1561 family protein [Pseudoneobacillus sp. C159]